MKLLDNIKQGKTYIIAEMSANHAGSLENAKEIIHAAKESMYFEAFGKVMGKIGKILEQGKDVMDYITEVCHSGFERLN